MEMNSKGIETTERKMDSPQHFLQITDHGQMTTRSSDENGGGNAKANWKKRERISIQDEVMTGDDWSSTKKNKNSYSQEG